MNELACPRMDERTLYNMPTGNLIVLARWARARYYDLPIIPADLHDKNRNAWREMVRENECWRFLADRCTNALTWRGVW